MTCSKCDRPLGGRLAFICYLGRGDEYTESFWFCRKCQVYTVESHRERFSGSDGAAKQGPIARADGDRLVALIKKCPRPNDKHCRCKTHEHFEG